MAAAPRRTVPRHGWCAPSWHAAQVSDWAWVRWWQPWRRPWWRSALPARPGTRARERQTGRPEPSAGPTCLQHLPARGRRAAASAGWPERACSRSARTAATVSSSAISASAASSFISILSGPGLATGAKRTGAIGVARARFTPILSGKNHCRPASIHVGCDVRCSAIGGAALGALLSA
eukprot:scaffold63665_cov67-Phaeocystis_antarctica.AAC.9